MAQLHWTRTAVQIYPSFRVDKENRDVIRLIQFYLARDERFEKANADYSLNKGILLMGNYGTGKTLMMQILQRCFLTIGSDMNFKRKNMQDLCSRYQNEGAKAFFNEYCHWFIDEMGITSREIISHYGNWVNIGDEIIGGRYNLFQHGYVTHITTNLNIEGLKSFYDGRTFSRINEMCNIIPLAGTDRRFGAKPSPPISPHAEEKKHDPEKAHEDWWQMIIRQHATYKKTGQIDIYGELRQWKSFEEAGIVKLSSEEKNALIARAKAEICEEPLPLERENRSKSKSLRESIITGVFSSEQQDVVRARAVRIAIRNLYDSHSEESFRDAVNEVLRKSKQKK